MLFIFRKLRQGLMKEGKASRYLGYAVGEIVLIVAGILIAVQIGKWNDARGEARLLQGYKDRLIANLEADIHTRKITQMVNNGKVNQINFLYEVVKDPKVVQGRGVEFLIVVRYAPTMGESPLFTTTFDELLSTGHMRLLDDALKGEVHRYYQFDQRFREYAQFRKDLALEYYKLSKGVLTLEQEEFLVDKGLNPFPYYNPGKVKTVSYEDEGEILAAINRLRENTDLLAFLPTVKSGFLTLVQNDSERIEAAEALLKNLKGSPEE